MGLGQFVSTAGPPLDAVNELPDETFVSVLVSGEVFVLNGITRDDISRQKIEGSQTGKYGLFSLTVVGGSKTLNSTLEKSRYTSFQNAPPAACAH